SHINGVAAVRLGRALATAAVIMASKLGTSSSEFLRIVTI
ncbi:hypothetical protein Tco_0560421, partial [Tanacetum coccineum]